MANKLILYYTPRSPPCRSVLLVAAEIGLDLDLRVMNLAAGEHMTAESLAKNPQHSIPWLDDNGTIIIDSHVICAYLADKYAKNPNLYPKEADKRRAIDTLMYFDASNVFSRIRFLYEPIIYFGQKGIAADKVEYIQKVYDPLENYLKHASYLAGNELTIADLCLLASVSSVTQTAPIDGAKYPKLNDWLERLKQLPYYQKVNGDGAQLLQDFVIEKATS